MNVSIRSTIFSENSIIETQTIDFWLGNEQGFVYLSILSQIKTTILKREIFEYAPYNNSVSATGYRKS